MILAASRSASVESWLTVAVERKNRKSGHLAAPMTKPVAFVVWAGGHLGGLEKRFARVAEGLAASGVSVTLFTSRAAHMALADADIGTSHCRVVYFGRGDRHLAGEEESLGPKRWESRVWRLRLITWILMGRFKGFHQVHLASDPGPITRIFAALSRFSPPFSVTVADSRADFDRERIADLREAVAVDCLSKDIARVLLERADPVTRLSISSKTRTAPGSFVPETPPPADARDIDVVFAARFCQGKGLDLLEGMKPLPARYELRVLGRGRLRPNIPHARIGFEPDLSSVLSRTKVFLSLQEVENYPSQSLLEAMAAGCAIVATDVGLTQLLVDDSTGIRVPRDPKLLREAIVGLLADPERCATLGEQGRTRIMKEFTLERFLDYFESEILQGY